MTEHDSLASALVAALADLTVVETGRTAEIPTKTGGKYTYKYADIADVVKLTRPVLAEHGIIALTPIHDHGSGLACTVKLLHTSGGFLDLGPFPFPHGKDAQATGSMVTYHRRYALVAALGMAAGDDDDGAAAAPRQEQADVFPEYADDGYIVPGLRTSVEAAIAKLGEDGKTALKAWLEAEDLPAVRRMSGDQCGRVIDHLMQEVPT